MRKKPKDHKEEIKLHVAGATVRHQNPFSQLPIPRNPEELRIEFLEKWVIPFYMTSFSDSAFLKHLKPIAQELSEEVVAHLLGDFNWRTRIVGAWFSAIKQYVEFEQVIGNLLLRSDVCYAGGGYCIALASFNTKASTEFLCMYLDYYLSRPDLYFDQGDAMGALAYLDTVNQTQNLERFISSWEKFVADKSNWDLTRSIESFAKQMVEVLRIQSAI
jgi:uncharacterized protein DUF6000